MAASLITLPEGVCACVYMRACVHVCMCGMCNFSLLVSIFTVLARYLVLVRVKSGLSITSECASAHSGLSLCTESATQPSMHTTTHPVYAQAAKMNVNSSQPRQL